MTLTFCSVSVLVLYLIVLPILQQKVLRCYPPRTSALQGQRRLLCDLGELGHILQLAQCKREENSPPNS